MRGKSSSGKAKTKGNALINLVIYSCHTLMMLCWHQLLIIKTILYSIGAYSCYSMTWQYISKKKVV